MENVVGERLRQYLKIKGVSHREFTEKCNLGDSFVKNIKTGSIGSDKLLAIKNLFPDVDVLWLIGYHDKPMSEAVEIAYLKGELKVYQDLFHKLCELTGVQSDFLTLFPQSETPDNVSDEPSEGDKKVAEIFGDDIGG